MTPHYDAPSLVPSWGLRELRATVRCLGTGAIVRGADGDRLSREICSMLGVRHALPVNRGRVALLLALQALGVGDGDDVVIPSYVCRSVLDAVRRAGARPVLADSDAGLHVSPESVRRAVTPRTTCVIVPHLYGNVAAIDVIERELKGTGIALIDDAAQAFGARCAGRPVGTFGRCGIVSTSLGKPLSGTAGGLLVTDDPDLFARAVALPVDPERAVVVARRAAATWVWFRLRRFTAPLKARSDRLFSQNYHARLLPGPMSNLDAAIAIEQCRGVELRALRRRERAGRVLGALGEAARYSVTDLSDACIALVLAFTLPTSGPSAEDAIPALARAGIEAKRGYKPLHHELGVPADRFPNAEALGRRTIHLPLSKFLEGRWARQVLSEVLGGST